MAWPYNFNETVKWIYHNIFGPSNPTKAAYPPTDIPLNKISPKLKLAFIGDIMPIGKRSLSISNDIIQFVCDADYIVGNFEGVISNKKNKPFLAQRHTISLLEELAKLKKPSNIVLSCANNHSGDFGLNEFVNSCDILKAFGFLTVGHPGINGILLDNAINIVACSSWSNQECPYLTNLKNANFCLNPQALFNILFPHWGYELYSLPTIEQLELSNGFISRWDAIIGHHSHYPQQISLCLMDKYCKLVAFSLGNFCTWIPSKYYRRGIILKFEVGPGVDTIWRIGQLNWSFIHIMHHKKKCEVGLSNP